MMNICLYCKTFQIVKAKLVSKTRTVQGYFAMCGGRYQVLPITIYCNILTINLF